jgi:hypothetical protein
MGQVVNLNQARKVRARQDASLKAQENRAFFGRTKDERARTQAEWDRQTRDLDGAKRDD